MTQPNGPAAPQQVTFRIPLDALTPWSLLDGAQHTLVGVSNILLFIGKPELAGFVAAHAQAIAEKRDEIVRVANGGIQLAQPGDLPKR